MCGTGPINPGPWTVVNKTTGRECHGAVCCTGTEKDAIGTAKYWNEQYKSTAFESKLMVDVPQELRAVWI